MDKKNQKSFSLRVAFVIACLMFIVLIINVNIEINSIEKEELALKQEIALVDREIERLQSEYEKPITDEMMRQLARDSLGFYMPGEIIYEVA